MYRPISIYRLIHVYFLGCLSEDRNRSVDCWRSGVVPAIDEFLETVQIRFAAICQRLLLVPMRLVTHSSLRGTDRRKSGESLPSESQDRTLFAEFTKFRSGSKFAFRYDSDIPNFPDELMPESPGNLLVEFCKGHTSI